MLKREKIVVFAALVAVIYAAYSLFMASPSKQTNIDTNKKKTEITQFIANLSEGLDKDALQKTDIYIIARAEAEWEKDPFLKTELAKESKMPKQQEVSFSYSGYIKMGDKKLAIINGVEYETGEELKLAGYIVERIEPLKVVIRGKEKQTIIIVPIKEEVF
jgi:hypothetical protein